MKILVTGGAGFIGSHTCVELLESNYEIIIIDDFSNSKEEVLSNIEKITNQKITFYYGDCNDRKLLSDIFNEHDIYAAIHFAAFKSISESIQKPLEYYENNLNSLLNLCHVMNEHGCKNLVFSSSASVYGSPETVPITEDFPIGEITNPYANTKVIIEKILEDLHISDPEWNIIILRYFNPIGAHKSGLIGENPNDIPNNLLPYVVKVANKEFPFVHVYGNDYDTPDATGVRDYIHVVDLAQGHVKAINNIQKLKGLNTYNLGTGKGTSVLELIKAFESANKVSIPYEIEARRPGDIAECYADTSRANHDLDWVSSFDISDMCKDAWNYINKK